MWKTNEKMLLKEMVVDDGDMCDIANEYRMFACCFLFSSDMTFTSVVAKI